jgi:hypothetical protein
MAAYLVHHPYFLIFVAGVAFGRGLSCAVLSTLPRGHTISVRRRCRIIVPISLILAVAAAGAGYINTIPGRSPVGAVILFTLTVLATAGMVLLPRWWRLAALIPPVLSIAVAVPLWIPYPRGYLDTQTTTTVTVTDDANAGVATADPEGTGGIGYREETTVPIVLVHIRSVSREDLLEITVAPVGDLLPVTSPRPNLWSDPLRLPLDRSVDITLTVLRHPPELWWFPPDGIPVALTVTADGDNRVFERFATASLPTQVAAFLASLGVVTTEQFQIGLPEDTEVYQQPGVYVVGTGRTPQTIR